jgi:hypothetical protein
MTTRRRLYYTLVQAASVSRLCGPIEEAVRALCMAKLNLLECSRINDR